MLSESEVLVDALALDESLCELLKLPDVDVLNESDVLALLEVLPEVLVEPLSDSLALFELLIDVLVLSEAVSYTHLTLPTKA